MSPVPSAAASLPNPDIAPASRRGLVLAAVAVIGAAAAIWSGTPASTDSVPPGEAARRAAAMTAAMPLHLSPVGSGELNAAWQSLALPPADLRWLQQDVQAGRLRLAWLGLFDSDAEDGDAVTVAAAGVTQTVPLSHRVTMLALPLPASGRIRLTGADEGRGGGVTVGIVAGGVAHKLPPLAAGQAYDLVVAAP